jgi:uncharacterized protein YecE (DUF72 family)
MPRVEVGTSGWSYDHWGGLFYPEDLPRSRWFDYYAERFSVVEVNYSFYRLPSESVIASWRNRAPKGFKYAMKGSRYISHRLRLKDSREPVARFCGRTRGLGEHLGMILWQLPPDLDRDISLLETFLAGLPGDLPHAVEFRHPSWLTTEVYSVLQAHETTLAWVSSGRMPRDLTTTADLVYARFHGLEGGYAHAYTREELAPWVAALSGREGFAFFNNDAEARAPADATVLRDLLHSTVSASGAEAGD